MFMGLTSALAAWLSAATLAGRGPVAQGQIYTFDKEPVPANHSLHTLHAFYVFSYEEAPEKQAGKPFVKFSGLVSAPSGGKEALDEKMKAYVGIQLSILRYRDFWDVIDPHQFCSSEADVRAGKADKRDQLLVKKQVGQTYGDVNVYAHTVRFSNSPQKDVKEHVEKTGVYILVYSNCGGFTDATVSGTVIVKNAYGFLPGNEYHKMPFYGHLLIIYVVLAVVWMGLSFRWWRELFMIQNCIAVVIFFGLVECFVWFLFFNDWNSSGVRGKFLFVLAILFTVLKSTFSYMLVLVASLGWGVTRPYLDTQVILKIQVLSFLYIVLDFIREAVFSFRHSHSLSIVYMLLCLLPVSLLNGTIFSWIFSALSHLMQTLKERRQLEKLAIFEQLWRILIGALSVATLTLLFQIFNLSRSITARWQYQWLLTDGISHGLFLVVLGAMMYLWAPHKYSQRYAFSQQIGGGADRDPPDHPGAIWADDDDLDDNVEDGESFRANAKANADVIGALKADSLKERV